MRSSCAVGSRPIDLSPSMTKAGEYCSPAFNSSVANWLRGELALVIKFVVSRCRVKLSRVLETPARRRVWSLREAVRVVDLRRPVLPSPTLVLTPWPPLPSGEGELSARVVREWTPGPLISVHQRREPESIAPRLMTRSETQLRGDPTRMENHILMTPSQ